ncbi:MAG: hypothetical protein P8Z49_09865 [Acidobacteriota bacterium]
MKRTACSLLLSLTAALLCLPASAQAVSLKPGVSAPDAWLAAVPDCPTNLKDARRRLKVCTELDGLLSKDEDIRSDRSERLGDQTMQQLGIPKNSQGGAVDPSKISAGDMNAISQMMGMMQESQGPESQRLMDELQQLSATIHKAEQEAKQKVDKEGDRYAKAQENCPKHLEGELGWVHDEGCERSVRQAHQRKLTEIADAFLRRVQPELQKFHDSVKTVVDMQQHRAAAANTPGTKALGQGMRAAMSGMSMQYIRKLNSSLLQVLGDADDYGPAKE